MPKILVCALAAVMASVACGTGFARRDHMERFAPPRVIISLDGEWSYRRPKVWQRPNDLTPWMKVRTPYCPEPSVMPERMRQVYRRQFVSPSLDGRRALLHFLCMPGVCEVFLNGRLAHVNGNGSVPFDIEVGGMLRSGTNEIEIVVRPVKDTENIPAGGIWYRQPSYAIGPQMGYSHPVLLELRPLVSIEDVTVVTHVTGGKRLDITVDLTNATDRVRSVDVSGSVGSFDVGGKQVRIRPMSSARVTISRLWQEAKLWTPDTPCLYALEMSLKEDGQTIDARRERFGFREFTWKQDKTYLNGTPFMLKRSNVSALWSTNEEQIVRIINRLKRRGLNGTRIEPQATASLVDIADELGFFVSPIVQCTKARFMHAAAWENWKRANLDHVRAYKNHPSVIAWGLGCEMGSYYGLSANAETNACLTSELQKTGLAVGREDPTRPWVAHGDNEVSFPCNTPGPAPIRTWHYPHPPTADTTCLPEGAWWFKRGELSFHGVSDRKKPTCFGEDFYHGFHDAYRGLSKWGGDKIWTLHGYLEAWRDAVWMTADGLYDAEIAGWNLWSVYEEAERNALTDDVCGGQLMPDFLISLRESFRNLKSGIPETRTLTVYNKRFLDRKIRLVREIFPRDAVTSEMSGMAVGCEEWRFSVPAGGRHVQTVGIPAPETAKRVLGFTHRYVAFDAETGEKLFARDWLYNVFPARKFCWPQTVVVISNGVADVASAISTGKPIIVTRGLSRREGMLLKKHVVDGGRVMIIDAKDGWLPLPLLSNRAQSYVFRRSSRGMPQIGEDMLVCWRPNTLLGTSGFAKVSDRTVQVIFDSGHKNGLDEFQIGRVWDLKGHWFLCQVPLLGEMRDAAADCVLAAAVREFIEGDERLDRSLVLAPDDKFCAALRNCGVLFETSRQMALKASVYAISLRDGDCKRKWEEAKRLAVRGGVVLVHDVTVEASSLLKDVGLTFRNIESCVNVTRTVRGGVLDGLSNQDLCFTSANIGNEKFIYENVNFTKRVKRYPNDLLEGVLSGCGVQTDPGSVAEIPWGKGKIVVTTIRWEKELLQHPATTLFTLRNLLRNMGVNAAAEKASSVECPIPLDAVANRLLWNDPTAKGRKAWFGGEDDMRYFPVNLCGWSRDSGNCCPVEPVPTSPIRYQGVPFVLSSVFGDNGKVPALLVLEPGEKVRMKTWIKDLSALWFLGALQESSRKSRCNGATVLNVRHGYQGSSVYEEHVVAGDHVNGFRWSSEVKRGTVGWTGYTKKETDAVLYVWPVKSSNTKGNDRVTSFVELENVGPVAIAIVGMTAEHGQAE